MLDTGTVFGGTRSEDLALSSLFLRFRAADLAVRPSRSTLAFLLRYRRKPCFALICRVELDVGEPAWFFASFGFISESAVEPASMAQSLWSFLSAREVMGSNPSRGECILAEVPRKNTRWNGTFRWAPQES